MDEVVDEEAHPDEVDPAPGGEALDDNPYKAVCAANTHPTKLCSRGPANLLTIIGPDRTV